MEKEDEAPAAPADLLEAAQVEDGVADQLSRAMEGDEAASAAAVDVCAQQSQPLQGLLGVGLPADPCGVDRRVLAQQQRVGRTGPVPVHIQLLQPQGLVIGDQAQANHLHQWPAAAGGHPAATAGGGFHWTLVPHADTLQCVGTRSTRSTGGQRHCH